MDYAAAADEGLERQFADGGAGVVVVQGRVGVGAGVASVNRRPS
jgi:hypothetical protein